MLMRRVAVILCCGLLPLSGCTVLDPLNVFGRNTDGSSNLGRKPVPVQQGPLASTYTRPGNTTIQPMSNNPVMPPVVVTSPAQAAPAPSTTPPQNLPPATLQPPSEASPLTVPTPPGLGAMDQRQRNSGTIIQTQAESKGDFSGMAINQPSINAPSQAGVEVKGPTIDLTVPGNPILPAAGASSNSFPPMLAPANSSTNTAIANVPMPSIEMPSMPAPNIPDVVLPSMPVTSNAGRSTTLNPGTKPPALLSPPKVPALPN